MSDWDTQKSAQLYNIGVWDEGYAEVLDNGNLAFKPRQDIEHAVDLVELSEEINAAGLTLPVLVRFLDVLHDRIDLLIGAFSQAIHLNAYQGNYAAVYPIKVNQQQSVVNEITQHDSNSVGLEAGSKAELMAVLASAKQKDNIIVCNGYKDRHYIRRALIGQILGRRVFIVIEKLSEIYIVMQEAQRLGVKPVLGLRVRLTSMGTGNWQNSGGEKSKFGLSATQVVTALDYLDSQHMLECLHMLHIHMGSQITDIESIHKGIAEASQYYSEIKKYGAQLSVINVGGGLGVDYESTASDNAFSMNYSVQEYANSIVSEIKAICEREGLPHPDIVTECGRAMTAHHAVLVCDVVEVEKYLSDVKIEDVSASKLTQDLHEMYQQLSSGESVSYSDVQQKIAIALDTFSKGKMTLSERAIVDHYSAQLRKFFLDNSDAAEIDREHGIEILQADKYFCNFSVFQSTPDVWGIAQVFPVVPLQKLQQKPERQTVLYDLTCDSDGHIEYYACDKTIKNSLPLHAISPNENYLLGIFLVGAYQEILGDMHNLFGDTHVVDVKLDKKGGHQLVGIERGDTTGELLEYVHYDTAQMLTSLLGELRGIEMDAKLLPELECELQLGLSAYTYLEN